MVGHRTRTYWKTLIGWLVQERTKVKALSEELENPMNPANRNVLYRQLSEFAFESDQKLHCNLDGEPIAKKKLYFSVLPKRLRLAY